MKVQKKKSIQPVQIILMVFLSYVIVSHSSLVISLMALCLLVALSLGMTLQTIKDFLGIMCSPKYFYDTENKKLEEKTKRLEMV